MLAFDRREDADDGRVEFHDAPLHDGRKMSGQRRRIGAGSIQNGLIATSGSSREESAGEVETPPAAVRQTLAGGATRSAFRRRLATGGHSAFDDSVIVAVASSISMIVAPLGVARFSVVPLLAT